MGPEVQDNSSSHRGPLESIWQNGCFLMGWVIYGIGLYGKYLSIGRNRYVDGTSFHRVCRGLFYCFLNMQGVTFTNDLCAWAGERKLYGDLEAPPALPNKSRMLSGRIFIDLMWAAFKDSALFPFSALVRIPNCLLNITLETLFLPRSSWGGGKGYG